MNPGPAVFTHPAPESWGEEWFTEATGDPFPDVELPDPCGVSPHDPFNEGVDPLAPPSRDPFSVIPDVSPDPDDPFRVAPGPAPDLDREPGEPFDPPGDFGQ